MEFSHDPVALALLPKDLHLPSLGHDESNGLLAKKLFRSIWPIVAVYTGDYRRQVRLISRVAVQSTLES